MQLTKAELVEAVAKRCGCSKTAANAALTDVFSVIAETLSDGNDVFIPNFGSFKLGYRGPRTGVKLGTDEAIEIPGCNVVKFKCSSKLKERINA